MLRVLGKNVSPHTTWTVNTVTSKILYHYTVSHQQVEHSSLRLLPKIHTLVRKISKSNKSELCKNLERKVHPNASS